MEETAPVFVLKGIDESTHFCHDGWHDLRIGVTMPDVIASYVFSVQVEHFHRSVRYHWMICSAQNPDRLVSWGHAPSQELAEAAAREEIKDLSSGLTQGGRVDTRKTMIHRL